MQSKLSEIHADSVEIFNLADADYPLQKKRHSFEYLRTVAHLRPRTNTFNAVFRIRSVAAFAIHEYFQNNGYVYVNTPIITCADCEGSAEMFKLTTLDLDKPLPQKMEKQILVKIYLAKSLHYRFWTASWRNICRSIRKNLHIWSNIKKRKFKHQNTRQRILDD